MDNLTHSLFGLTLARTRLGRVGRGATAALLLASNAPDLDAVSLAGGTARYLQWHRGPTHGPFGILGLAFLVALLVRAMNRWRAQGPAEADASFLSLWLVSMAGVACHILMDFPTPYGTRLLSPFNWTWFSTDWMPIVDIYLLAALGACLWFGRTAPARNARLALAFLLLDYGVRAASHQQALERARAAYGAQLPAPCATAPAPDAIVRWPRGPVTGAPPIPTRCLIELAAIPGFTSPFEWRLIARLPNDYELRDLDLLRPSSATARSDVRLMAVRYPNVWTPTVEAAARAATAQTFLGFARFAAARSATTADGTTVVRWTDMRFAGRFGGAPPRDDLFTATIRVDGDGRVLSERLGP